jgi:hypothetical protein
LRRQIGLSHDQVHLRQLHGVVPGLEDALRFVLIAGLQALLLSGGAVFAVEDLAAFEVCESVLHLCLSFYGHKLKTIKQE